MSPLAHVEAMRDDEPPDETVRITIDLPVPAHKRSDRGFIYLKDWLGTHERSHADRPVVALEFNDAMDVAAAEEYALAVLWLVRHHYQGRGLLCEVAS